MLDQIIARLSRMVKFDHAVYREIAEDEDATLQAAAIVVAVAFIAALGALIQDGFWQFLLTLFVRVPLAWVVWSGLTYLICSRLFGGVASLTGILRVFGYSSAALALGLFGVFGRLLGWILAVAMGVIATRDNMEIATEQAILPVVVSGLFALLPLILG